MRRRHEEKGNGELSERLVILAKPEDVAAEAYRTLRTNLLYAFADNPPKVIVVSSPGPEEGKSTTCANLAVALAQAGKEVLIIDGDLRAPVLHKYFGLRNVHGLVSVLTQQCNLEEAWHELTSELKELKILTAGPVPYNPTELLSSQRFAEFAGWVREDFDYILFDAPPVGLSSDAAIAATRSDGVLLVIDSRRTRKSSVRRSMRSLEAIGVRVLGTVMNHVEVSDDRSYGGSYAYKSGSK